MKKIFTFIAATLLAAGAVAETVVINPMAETAFRTNVGWNGETESTPTAWQNGFPKTNQATIECTYSQRMWAQEMFDVTDIDLANAKAVSLKFVNANASGYRLGAWIVPNADWNTEEAQTWTDGVCPVVETFKEVVGAYPSYKTEKKTYLAYADAPQDEVKMAQVINFAGASLETLKAGVVTKEGRNYISFIITFRETDASYSTSRNPKYYGIGNETEENRPTMTVEVETAAVVNNTTGAGYASLAAAVADIPTITAETNMPTVLTINKDVEISSRLNIKTQNVTIKGATGNEKILRAESYKNGLMFLTQDTLATLTVEDLIIDGQDIESSAAVFEAGNKGLTVLNNISIEHVVTTGKQGVISNKSNARLVINGVRMSNCTADNSKALVFVGTNKVTLSSTNDFGAIHVEKANYLINDGATNTQAIVVDDTRAANFLLVKNGQVSNFTISGQAEGLELVQDGNDIYLADANYTSAIEHIMTDNKHTSSASYNIFGQQATSAKGFVISNGRKMLCK